MFESFPRAVGERLERPAYHQDFRRTLESGVGYLNKLERGQHFQERGFASWEAFAAGEWEHALDLIGEKRDVYREQLRTSARRGVAERRLRVVEFPVTPYVQWELHVLRLRVELGDCIRVLDARTIKDVEKPGPVPEVVILGASVMYEVRYDVDGNAAGANRFSDRTLVAETTAGFEALYERAEIFDAFFDREIRSLPAPAVGPKT
ncbi:DUF6879 family protein [Actinoallomurus iriomotensis]|uniref:DUF6879 domain-containing protein n=1 Tax=Actinoallomurus iriomotensis TaxID=478107 RepID=A0A9W6S230_9ACTN|nr:DUF6879 family protein [Actinoallomurus iriomotensis]GLY85999.1 hypothetical protein Airi02_039280 [Actinoallomurus iriomotensis]